MSQRIRWVPEAAVRAMHAELVAEHGGRAGIRDAGLLSSALARPRNRRVYGASTTLFELAAGSGVAIIRNHPFIDGNKRYDRQCISGVAVRFGSERDYRGS